MKKELRFKNTDYYEYENVNPKNRYIGDCVIRAIARGLEQSWEQTVRELTELGIKDGNVCNDKRNYEKYLSLKGWIKCDEPRKADNTKMTIEEFCKSHVVHKAVVHAGSHHVCAIINNKVHDTWNSSRETMHTYWVKR